jgi:hypothetical protein
MRDETTHRMNTELGTSMLGQEPFRQLDDLCRANPEIFSMNSSPTEDQLRRFYQIFKRTEFVRGLSNSVTWRRR